MLEPQRPQRLTQSKRPTQHPWACFLTGYEFDAFERLWEGMKAFDKHQKPESWRPEESPVKGRGPEQGGADGAHTDQAVGRGVWKGTEGAGRIC